MSAVYLGSVEPMVFRPTEVETLEWVAGDGPMRPPVVPDFDEPCPDCESHWNGPTDKLGLRCPTCNGTGVIHRVWRAERQWRHKPSQEWGPWHPCKAGGRAFGVSHESRQAVVSWYPVTVLNVEDTLDDWPAGSVVVIPGDEVRLDEPITTMRTPFAAFHAPVIAPLALTDGLNDVDLGGQP